MSINISRRYPGIIAAWEKIRSRSKGAYLSLHIKWPESIGKFGVQIFGDDFRVEVQEEIFPVLKLIEDKHCQYDRGYIAWQSWRHSSTQSDRTRAFT